MSPSVFQAEVTYCLTTTNALPSTQNDWEPAKKKRSSGLGLLRPKSSHGGGRSGILSPEPIIKPLSSYPIPPPPPVPSRNNDDKDPSWKKDRYDTQRATLRHTRSIPQLPPLTAGTSSQKRVTSSSLSNKWRRGVILVHVHGEGGSQGGALTIYENDDIVYRQPLKPLPDINWSIDDIQKIHPSVYDKPFVLSLYLQGSSRTSSDSRKSSSYSRGRPLKPQMYTLSKIGRRARGYTITKVDTTSTASSGHTDSSVHFEDGLFSGQENVITPETSISTSNDEQPEQVLLLDFNTEKEKNEWFVLLRSYSGNSLPRVERRLQIRVLDLQESIPFSSLQLGSARVHRGEEALCNTAESFDQISARSSEPQNSNRTPGTIGKNDRKAGWAGKDRLKVEIYNDNQLMGQTIWTQAEDRSEIPFWAELFTFENVRDFSNCVLKICRLRSGKSAQPFATVSLPLVPGFMKSKDERYPIISLSGHVVGELRLIVTFTVVNVVGMNVYPLPEVFHGMGGTRTIYYMMSKGLLDQCIDLFTRFNWALGTTYNRLVEMSEIEAKASGDTLFRGNTPMTRLLEATMRLVCFDFLRLSIGPTITVILDNELVASHENTRSVIKLLDDCWEDMYSQRGTFPNILRQVFAVLFKNVKENHAERKLRYKAVSSFLFLRLIGPALMRPHLFGLTQGLPKLPVQRTLTLVAKIFHTLAFFTWSDTACDPELARYTIFIRKNHDTMVDYLSSFATPLDDFQCRPDPPSSIATFLAARLPLLPPEYAQCVPMLTVAGPVEVDADAAVFYELLYQRRKAKVGGAEMTREDGVVPGEEEEMKDLIRTMDQFISSVHRASYEHVTGDTGSSIHSDPRESQRDLTSSARPITPSRPSLQIDVHSAQRDRKLDLTRSKSNLFEGGEMTSSSSSRRAISPNPNRNPNPNLSSSNAIPCRDGNNNNNNNAGSAGGAWKWLNFGWMSPTFRPPGMGYDPDVTSAHPNSYGFRTAPLSSHPVWGQSPKRGESQKKDEEDG
ncbi:uncharacterized protein I303_105982 [Kwoniella dejecticola CBS 10117]|uniref:Ras-GAP domain-containing protein n=1 Tax=Kwoniella dejecticola CBS 10117 TaxID=1296121 RepID=A0A1A6A0Y9_9TREE|nr:uncharacterized protein I303_06002 [Kwoniella dejecticola CBS 10117]OBR83722.1 hypothetical protein I303_06002 [Kwoniella dejecticola CBS 10117]